MRRRSPARRAWAGAALLAIAPMCGAQTCEALRGQIDAKIRAGGVARFELEVVDAGATLPGRVVGRCDLGRRKIVYRPDAAPAVRPKPAPILTECKDGSVSLGGDCRK